MSVDDFKLRTKVLIPLVLMALGVLAVAALGAVRLIAVSSAASDIIERRNVAAVEIDSAAQMMDTIPHAIFAILLYDQKDEGRAAWKKQFETLPPQTVALLDQAAAQLPDFAVEIVTFKERVAGIGYEANSLYDLSVDSPRPGPRHWNDRRPDRRHEGGGLGSHRARLANSRARRRHERAVQKGARPKRLLGSIGCKL